MKKSIRKILTGIFVAGTALLLSGCYFLPKEDESLKVDFRVSGKTTKAVTMNASSDNISGKEVYIIYTLDDSEPEITLKPSVDMNDLARANEKTIRKLVNYGSAELIKSGETIDITETTTIKAKAFYILAEDLNPLWTSKLFEKTISFEEKDTSNITDNSNNATGNLNFKIASSGNSYSTHYFDSSSNPFTYSYGGETYEHCYYQFQFSWTGKDTGNWYLYVRKIGQSKPIGNAELGTNFLARGKYTGPCFNDSSKEASDGVLVLKTNRDRNFATINIASNTFEISIDSDTANAKGNLAIAIQDSDSK